MRHFNKFIKIKEIIIYFIAITFITINCIMFSGFTYSIKYETDSSYSAVSAYASNVNNEIVNYTYKETEFIETQNGVPLYNPNTSLSNSCGATAGAIVLGFYDKYYENLIPNYIGYNTSTGKYRPNDLVHIPALMSELYDLMRINVDDVGVSEDDCLNGLKNYVTSKNHSISYSSIVQNKQVNKVQLTSSINANNPILLFCGNTELIKISSNQNQDNLVKSTITENHIYVGYGFYTIKYFNGSTNFRTDLYMRVACGLFEFSEAYINIATTINNFDNGYAISIY